ncbi:membrane protein insertion efficiency factor YidD [Frankia sp. AiPa1]|uniref:membrane protein insertion efficiency factor YidD n=1 Tax=Frankia sp. AiPa1 TaxID=573492 RepID=UPI0027E4A79D|nr:membrane protein insertion efficiency factor YidD [Frankia sp. AiPa1]
MALSGRNAGMCRFEPSCSAYALEAVCRHGAVRGAALALVRLLRCQPLSAGGYDPVPGGPAPGRGGRYDPGADSESDDLPPMVGPAATTRWEPSPGCGSFASPEGWRTSMRPVPKRRPAGAAVRRVRGRGPRSSVPVADRGREE